MARMTWADAAEMLEMLSLEFGPRLRVRKIALRWSDRPRAGRAHRNPPYIAIGPNCWRGVEAAMVHEFAHHLAWVRGGEHRHDSAAFIAALEDVVTAWYGSLEAYPWTTEYKTIARYAAGRAQSK